MAAEKGVLGADHTCLGVGSRVLRSDVTDRGVFMTAVEDTGLVHAVLFQRFSIKANLQILTNREAHTSCELAR